MSSWRGFTRPDHAIRTYLADDIQYPVPNQLYIVGNDVDAGRSDLYRHAIGIAPMKPGDSIIVRVEGIGSLENSMA